MMDRNKLGMLLFIISESFFFGMLILAYVYFNYRGAPIEGPTAATSLQPATAAIFTLVLLSSSVTLWLAERNLARQRRGGTQRWLLVTVVLGATFLLGQAWEYRHLISEDVTISRNLFGTTFFTLTGFHGLHVLSGLIALTILLGLLLTGRLGAFHRHAMAVETVGWYWHFVDVVWIIIFALIYVAPFV